MKNVNDCIGNRPRDLPSRCAVPQPVILFSCYFYLTIEMKHTYTRVVKRNAVLLQAIRHFENQTTSCSVLFQHRSEHSAHMSANCDMKPRKLSDTLYTDFN
jgi:hypothetical protein